MLNLTNLFEALGRCGRTAYLIASGQAPQGTPFSELSGYSFINPEWIANLALSYDSLIRSESAPMQTWSNAAQTILQQLVAADNPYYGTTLPLSLSYFLGQMTAQSKTVQSCTIGDTVAAYSTNIGTGTVFVTLQRADGLILQNTIAEESNLLIMADSYTGGATAGQEPWQWNGAPNVSSLGTGTSVGLWDWDWPQGSATTASGNAISPSQYAVTSGNYLTNGDFANWPVALNGPLNWFLAGGTWGTDIQQSSTSLGGAYSVEFLPGTGATEALTQQFGSSATTGSTAGTPVSPAAFNSFCSSLWLKAAGSITGGVMTVSLVNGSGAVIQDQNGNNNSYTIALTGLSASWVNHTFSWRLPTMLPSAILVKIQITTALTGAGLFMDAVCFAAPTNCYSGGPSIAVFSNPAVPFENVPVADGFTITFTNNRGGSSYGATWQTLLNRLFQTPDFIINYSNSPNILDTLITNA